MITTAMRAVFDKYDDLEVVGRDLTDQAGLTLVSLVHNEMYFLPAFLDHYRALGVARFVFIDDQSTDESPAFLSDQPDVMVLRSHYRFGDTLAREDARVFGKSTFKMNTVWRQLLLTKYCTGAWGLCIDVDEFIDLPAGMTFADLADKLDAEGVQGAWAVMLDMYPDKVDDLAEMADDTALRTSASWYFDGEPHLRLHPDGPPMLIYSGTRARLLHQYELNHRVKPWKAAALRMLGRPAPFFNDVHKPAFLRWSAEALMTGPHSVKISCSKQVLLPLRHYKFSGETGQRMDWALQTQGYAGGSVYYSSVARLLERMAQTNASFRYPKSRLYRGFADFVETGNALGFDDPQ